MQALYYDEQKGYRAIKLGEMPMPEITETEVLVRVKAFSLNHLDVWVMEGKYPLPVPLPHIFGSDSAGVVERVGKTVTHVRPGDEVIVLPGLSCGACAACAAGRDNECRDYSLIGVLTPGVSAEFVKAPAANVVPKPAGLSFEEAAGIGITYTTAWNGLVLRAGIRPGETVVVQSAGSGAGTACVQVAKHHHAKVIATVGSDDKAGKARAIGADLVVNYLKEDAAAAVKRFTDGALADIVVDHAGGEGFSRSLAMLRRGGRLVTFGATAGDEVTVSLRQVFGKNLAVHGIYVGPRTSARDFLPLFPGRLRTVVDAVFPFADAPKAYEKLLSRQVFGKIVVTR